MSTLCPAFLGRQESGSAYWNSQARLSEDLQYRAVDLRDCVDAQLARSRGARPRL